MNRFLGTSQSTLNLMRQARGNKKIIKMPRKRNAPSPHTGDAVILAFVCPRGR